jgi:hypothetical protein
LSRVQIAWVRFALALALVARAGWAESVETSVAVVGPHDAPLTLRLHAEFAALGLDVLVVDGPSAPLTRTELEAVARRVGAALAVHAAESPSGVELTIVDRVTGKTLVSEVLARDPKSSDPDTVVALRAVELLHASLLEMQLGKQQGEVALTKELREMARLPAPVQAPPATTAANAPPAPRPESALEVELGVALAGHAGGPAATPGISGALWWRPGGRVATGIWAFFPVMAAKIERAQGTAELETFASGSGLRVVLGATGSRLTGTLGAGAAVLWTNVVGKEAASTYELGTARLVTAGPYGEGSVAFHFTPALAVRAELRAAVTFPHASVEFVGHEVAELGRPFLLGGLGLEYRAVFTGSRD